MGKETKVGLLVGMCFIVCCAIVLSHHGRRRAEAQDLSVTNAERSRKAPLLLDRNTSAERATKRIAPSRTSKPRNNRVAQPRNFDDKPVNDDRETQLADSQPSGDGRWKASASDSQAVSYGFERMGDSTSREREVATRPSSRTSEPFIHRGPPIPDVVAPKTSMLSRRNDDELVVLDDDSNPLVANIPLQGRQESIERPPATADRDVTQRRTLTSTPSPAPTSRQSDHSERSIPTRIGNDMVDTRRSNESPMETKHKATATRTAMDRHVVQEGENLSRIAEQYYGSSEPKILDAIVKANHETMSGPNHIVSGQELLLPGIEGVDSIRHEESPAQAPQEPVRNNDRNEQAAARSSILAEYEVQPGDLLSRVVSRHYGSASKRIIDAVYQANMDRMKSPDQLVAGTVIVLPEVGNIQPKQVDAGRKAQDAPIANTATEEEPFRWYVVQKGDTYSTIAAAQMGTSKRWQELAEFNKTVFKDATQIRHGVRIRIPTGSSSNSQSASNRRSR